MLKPSKFKTEGFVVNAQILFTKKFLATPKKVRMPWTVKIMFNRSEIFTSIVCKINRNTTKIKRITQDSCLKVRGSEQSS